jgi:SAM-dependent methyltransferase
LSTEHRGWAIVALNWGLFWGGLMAVQVAAMLWGSRVGKLRERERMLDELSLRGDERVLDVGCGRGLLLIGAAKRLTTGKAVGVDIWQAKDLSQNRPEATLENARLEQVPDRVELKDGRAEALPFEDQSFDVVLSMSTLHNLPGSEARRLAVREIVRGPASGRPGLDPRHRPHGGLRGGVQEAGMRDVVRSRRSSSGAFLATRSRHEAGPLTRDKMMKSFCPPKWDKSTSSLYPSSSSPPLIAKELHECGTNPRSLLSQKEGQNSFFDLSRLLG